VQEKDDAMIMTTTRGAQRFLVCLSLVALAGAAPVAESPSKDDAAGPRPGRSKLVYPGPDGRLVYMPAANGDTIPDFSNCGYMGGGVRLPDVAVMVTLEPTTGGSDDTARIQQAIDDISKRTPDADGFRGAVLLKKGTYRVNGQLKIVASGVVLRGEGQDADGGTVVIAVGKDPRVLIEAKGTAGAQVRDDTRTPITSERVPVGARTFAVKDASGFKVGDAVIVSRAGNAAWITAIGMDRITPRHADNPTGTKQWQPFELPFDRVITAIDGNRVTVDAPITCAIEQQWGGGSLARYDNAGRIEKVGVENIRFVSEYDATVTRENGGKSYPADEAHSKRPITFDNLQNGWVGDVTAVHFQHGVAQLGRGAKWVTVQDSTTLAPVSILTGGQRYPFSMDGQLLLVLRCKSEGARHAFVLGSRVCGPNAFVDCRSWDDHGSSEPHHRWSVGGLYDHCDANVAIQDRQYMGSGHGWAGANYVVWNGRGRLVAQTPPTANTWVVGFVGERGKGAFEPKPDATWDSLGQHVEPRSLYFKQLEDRLGKQAVAEIER
jgi:hypothetical protein